MADNPVKYSDLLSPDDSIKNLISELEKAQEIYAKLIKEIKESAKELNQTLKTTKTTTEEGRKAAKEAAAEAERLASVQKRLTDEQKKNAIELEKLKQQEAKTRRDNANAVKAEEQTKQALIKTQRAEQQQSKARAKQLTDETSRYKQLSTELNRLRTKAKDVGAEFGITSNKFKNAAREVRRLDKDIKNIDSQLGLKQRNVGNYASAFKALAGSLIPTSLGIGAIGIALKETITVFSKFEKQMSQVRAVSGATGEEYIQLKQLARDLGESTQFTATQVAGLEVEYSKLGFTAAEIISVTDGTLALAKAAGTDLSTAAQVAGATLRGFGLDVSETNRVTDSMAKSFSTSALDITKFRESMKYVAPVAKAAGVSLEQATGMLATLADAGISGSQAGTSLRRILSEMSKTGKPTEEAFAAIAKKGMTLTDAFDEVGRTAQTAFLVLSENQEKTGKLTKTYENAAGAAKEMADIMADNLSGDADKATSAIEGLAINIGEKLSPTLRTGLAVITRLVAGINSLFSVDYTRVNVIAKAQEEYNAKLKEEDKYIKGIILSLKSEYTSKEDKMKLVEEYNKKYGANLKYINDETKLINGLTTSYNSLSESIKRNIAIESSRTQITKLLTDISVLEGTLTNYEQQITTLSTIGGSPAQISAVQQMADKIKADIAISKKEIEGLESFYKKTNKERNPNEEPIQSKSSDDLQRRQLEIDVMQDYFSKEIAQLKLNVDKKRDQYKALGIDETMLDRWAANEKIRIAKEYRTKAEEIEAGRIKKEYETALQGINLQHELQDSEIDALKETEAEKTRLKLEAEKERINAILELNKKAGAQLSATQIKILENQIKAIDNKLAEIGGGDGASRDIYAILGINMSENVKQGIAESSAFAIEQVRGVFAAQSAISDAKVAQSNKEVNAIKNRLDTEVAARNAGYASSVVQAQKELALAKKTQDKALAEQERAQRVQERINTIKQVSDLVTAAAGIWATFKNPFLAVPAIALMFGTFAAAKVKAGQAAKVREYGDGGYEVLSGGSHASGNDINMGVGADGSNIRAEGGEGFAVFSKKATAQYGETIPNIVDSINRGEFADKWINAYNTGQDRNIVITQTPANLSGLEKGVNTIARNTERQTYTDGRGRTIIKNGNHKRIINNGN